MAFHPPHLRIFDVEYSVDCFPFHIYIDRFSATLHGKITCDATTLWELDEKIYKEAHDLAMAQAIKKITSDRENRLAIDARK